MNQGKLDVIKQEMARVNIDILQISELKWTGMGEFNSDGHIISTTVGKNPLEEMEYHTPTPLGLQTSARSLQQLFALCLTCLPSQVC